MTTETVAVLNHISIETEELSKFRRQDAAIAKLADKFMPLTIDGINDKSGFKAVHDARMVVKKTRVAVETTRKELKADALKYGQTVDAEARRLTALLEPIESHLQAEEDSIEAAKAKIKKAAEDAKRAAFKVRIDALSACGQMCDPLSIGELTDKQFAVTLQAAQEAAAERERLATIERQRLAAEAEVRRIEAEQLAAERARLAEIDRAQKIESDRLRAEQQKIADQSTEQKRVAELEAAKKEAAERARIETEQRIAAQATKDKAEAEAKEAARLKAEAERPHRERLLEVARNVEAVEVPEGPWAEQVHRVLAQAGHMIQEIAKGPLG